MGCFLFQISSGKKQGNPASFIFAAKESVAVAANAVRSILFIKFFDNFFNNVLQ